MVKQNLSNVGSFEVVKQNLSYVESFEVVKQNLSYVGSLGPSALEKLTHTDIF